MADLGFGARLASQRRSRPTECLWQVRVLSSGISREMDESKRKRERERKASYIALNLQNEGMLPLDNGESVYKREKLNARSLFTRKLDREIPIG